MAAEHDHAGFHETKSGSNGTGDEFQSIVLCQLPGRQDILQPTGLCLIVTCNEHLILPGDRVQLLAHSVDIAAETFD